MSARKGSEPVSDEEYLYRRIPFSPGWYDPEIDERPSYLAFMPRRADTTGLSMVRGKYVSVEEAGGGGIAVRHGKKYYVAIFRAGDLRKHGIRIASKPSRGNPGHAEIPDIRFDRKDWARVQAFAVLLAEDLCIAVEGPFPS